MSKVNFYSASDDFIQGINRVQRCIIELAQAENKLLETERKAKGFDIENKDVSIRIKTDEEYVKQVEKYVEQLSKSFIVQWTDASETDDLFSLMKKHPDKMLKKCSVLDGNIDELNGPSKKRYNKWVNMLEMVIDRGDNIPNTYYEVVMGIRMVFLDSKAFVEQEDQMLVRKQF